MMNYDEQDLFDCTKQRVADVVSMLMDDGTHPALVLAAMMSVILQVTSTEGFWDDGSPSFDDIRGFGNMTWMLQEKAFSDLAAGTASPNNPSTV
jgi:hypothetical protein